ncbi:sugar phosphate isomerase/epimerase [Hydrogenispora ethanolica]|uniref:Sugar phosphate isomerase/epimerase n=1 Tax=Hydrogenispora ethanolica TaxID=1082276 RepID=A0A4R1RRI9_HYDET|nr:sugar phosphate isomerase/epimerase family protein [Hydrogenispora ethanolica]TCL68562.1 sugar phosphate isomerase/epimerase [Hydrogenispora ethanolica]
MSQFILSAFADEIADDLQTQMDVLEEHDIHFIEMRGVNGRPLVQHSLDEVRAIKAQLDARGFRISAVGSPIGKIKISDPFEPHLELFRHTLEIAKILETGYIRMFSFFLPPGEDPRHYRAEVLRRWEALLQAADGTGLVLLHENEKEIYGDTPERCLDLLTSFPGDGLRAVFDPANFVQCDVETFPGAYRLLEDYVVYMHIKDAVASDHHVVPAGYGDGKVPAILAALQRRGYEGFLSLEPHLGSFKGFAALEPNSPANQLPEGGPKQFAIAVAALKKILAELPQ